MRIIYISDPEIIRIPINECHEPLVDIRQDQQLAYGPPPECELTKDDYYYLRKTVYEKILAAQASLPHGWRFRLYEGYRSLRVQKMLFDDMHTKTQQRLPEASEEDIFHETTRLVSPVINFDGTTNIPAHNTGAAVDIEIMDQRGRLIDMGMSAADWVDVDPAICETHCETISKMAQQNRQLLLKLMTQHGFVNYPTEWWHYSYGDRYWAYHAKSDHAIYGAVDESKHLV